MNIEKTLASTCKILVDESFLLDDAGRAFLLNRLLPELNNSNDNRLILAERVHQNIVDFSQNERSLQQESAKQAIELIMRFANEGRLDLRQEESEVAGKRSKTSDLFARVVYQHQLQHELAFLTLDETCARGLLATNRAESINHAKAIRVLRFNDDRTRLDDWSKFLKRSGKKKNTNQITPKFDLDSLAVDSKILIDTCSLMTDSAESFIKEKLIPALKRANTKLIVAQRVVFELEKHLKSEVSEHRQSISSSAESTVLEKARKGLHLIELLIKENLIDIRHEENEVVGNDIFFDALVQRIFIQHQKNSKLALITQDTKLAKQILENAVNFGANEFPPQVGFINEKGSRQIGLAELGNWEWRFTWKMYEENPETLDPIGSVKAEDFVEHRQPTQTTQRKAKERFEPFAKTTKVYSGSTSLIKVGKIPDTGDYVIGEKLGRIKLIERISEGGEGTIYRTSHEGTVCKIYMRERLTEDRRSKLQLMTTRESPSPTICWPFETVNNLENEFVGYLMPMARGEVFSNSIFKKPLLIEMFPNWGRKELVTLAITTLGLIRKLHALNVVIGDINPNNFMVCNENEVYIVDTDSFQIEEYPCPVGTPHFTPPELMGKTYASFLRTQEDEIFAVATLLFMILLPGKPPYAGKDGGDVVESIKNKKFPYVVEEGQVSAKPFGPFKAIWSHLHRLLQDDFKSIFKAGVRTPSAEQLEKNKGSRTFLDLFDTHLRIYRSKIEKGESSNELFPSEPAIDHRQEVLTLICPVPGCSKSFFMAKSHHDQLIAQNSRRSILCDKHREINGLARAMQARAREREQQQQTGSRSANASVTGSTFNRQSNTVRSNITQSNQQSGASSNSTNSTSIIKVIVGVLIVGVVLLAVYSRLSNPRQAADIIPETREYFTEPVDTPQKYQEPQPIEKTPEMPSNKRFTVKQDRASESTRDEEVEEVVTDGMQQNDQTDSESAPSIDLNTYRSLSNKL